MHRFHVVLMMLAFAGFGSRAVPAPPPDWEVLRIFIPYEQISRLVTSDYAGILIEDLARKLAEANDLRKLSMLDTPVLEEAIYVARLDGDNIVSDQSRWTLSGSSTPQALSLGNISVALRSARGILPDQPQLLERDQLQFDSGGAAELLWPGGRVNRWFGFSAHATHQSLKRTFAFRMPAASKAKMLIATPASAELNSPTLVVEKIQSPSSHLPSDWPLASSSSASGVAAQWWLVHLSGAASFELTAEQQAATSLTWYKHLVRSGSLDYSASEKMLLAHAKFVVAGHQKSLPLCIRVGEKLRIREVRVNESPVHWRVQPNSSEDSHSIEILNAWRDDRDVFVEIDASCEADTAKPVALPEIAIAESYAMDGGTRVWGLGGLIVEDLETGGCSTQRLPLPVEISREENPTANQWMWQANWQGDAPHMNALFSRQRTAWIARTLTRFTIQSDWLAANCRLHIDSHQVDSNEIRLPVGGSWFIDHVKLGQSGTDIRARVEDREGAEGPVIVVGWEGKRDSISLELDVMAHSPRDTHANSMSLRSPRLITLPGADQIDNYVIEPSSRFRVQLGSSLLRFQLPAVDLPDWQQQLLPQLTDKWIFQGVYGTIPPITLAASGGTYSCKVSTVVKDVDGNLNAETTIQCNPLSGSIDRLDVVVPAGIAGDAMHWWLLQDGAGNDMPLLVPQESSLKEAGAATDHESLLQLELPTAYSTPFTLRAQVRLQAQENGALSVPILGTPAASYGESILILPRELASPVAGTSVELLPATLCCTDGEISKLVGELALADQMSLVAARMEVRVGQLIELRERERVGNSGWVWSEVLRHTLLENGGVDHEVRWEIEAAEADSVEVVLPSDWQPHSAVINGERIDVDVAENKTMIFKLSSSQKFTLHLRAYSPRGKPGWLSYERLQRPQISLPVLERIQTLAIPPSRMSLRVFENSQQRSRLADRLLPSAWWRLLAPANTSLAQSPPPILAGDPYPPDWTVVELKGDRYAMSEPADLGKSSLESPAKLTPPRGDVPERLSTVFGEWTISRTAFSAMALAGLLALAATFWSCLGSSVRVWWLAISIVIVLVIWVPAHWLPIAQLILLALSCAALLRLCAVVGRIRAMGQPSRGGSGVVSHARGAPTTALLLLLSSATTICAQPTAYSGTSLAGAEPGEDTEIFGVLIPVDREGEVSGAYAYAPTRLLELLAGNGQGFVRATQPRILSADYTLRTRRSLLGQQDQVQEFSVELRIEASQMDTEIRLPFKRDQVYLQRGTAAGQELFIGGRSLSQLLDAIVFRPSSIGTVRLQLQLEPLELKQVDGQTILSCAVPPIPNATLRIVADGSSAFEVTSIGSGPKTVSSASVELLGPVDLLDVRWSSIAPRGAGGQAPTEVFADTWLHARGSQVSAICQLRIANAKSLPRELHVVAEPGWEPVGASWGDGQLIESELSSLGGRRVYTIRFAENWSELSRRAIRVLMVPREAEALSTLTLPFLSLREVSLQAVTRTLAWSSEDDATWRPEGLDFWQEIHPLPILDWGTLKWNAQPRLYRVPSVSMATSVRRVARASLNAVDEITRVHLGLGESRIAYRAQCQAPGKGLVALTIPRTSRVDSILLDGNIPNYRVSERGQEAVIEILPSDAASTFRVVELELSQPLKLDREAPLPRVVLRGFEANSSSYRLLCGTGLTCQLQSDSELKLETASVRPHELMSTLETLVGQVDLRNSYRESARLPLSFTLRRKALVPVIGSIMYLDRLEQGWNAKLITLWDTSEQPLDYAFFELPAAVRETVNTGHYPARFIPMGDSGRMTLCLMPSPPVAGKTRIEFDFQLSTLASSQSISVPQVAVLSNAPIRPTLALPESLNGQTIQWVQTGRRLDDSWKNPLGDEGATQNYQFFDFETSQSQVNWKLLQSDPQRAELLASQLKLLRREGERISGYVDYWIQPNGQLSLPVDIPEQCEVLGVEIGGRPAIWHQSNTLVSVLLQPNYLPVNIRVLLHWRISSAESLRLRLPQVRLTEPSPRAILTVDNQILGWRMDAGSIRKPNTTVRQELVNHWAEMLIDTFPAIRGQSASEIESWLENWHPRMIGFDGSEIVDSELVNSSLDSLGIDIGDDLYMGSCDELWNAIRLQAMLLDDANSFDVRPNLAVEPSIALMESYRSSGWVRQQGLLAMEQDVLVLHEISASSGLFSRITAACLLAVASLLALILSKRLSTGYASLLAVSPWVYWLQLAFVAWLILPVAWPSWILVATAIGMLISQTAESRRRNRLLTRL